MLYLKANLYSFNSIMLLSDLFPLIVVIEPFQLNFIGFDLKSALPVFEGRDIQSNPVECIH